MVFEGFLLFEVSFMIDCGGAGPGLGSGGGTTGRLILGSGGAAGRLTLGSGGGAAGRLTL